MKRLLSFLLVLMLILSISAVSVNAEIDEEAYQQLLARTETLADGERLKVSFDHTFEVIPSYTQIINEVSKLTDVDPGGFPGHYLTVDEAREYYALYRAVRSELIKANTLAAMEKLGLDFDDVDDIGYSEDTVGWLGMPHNWRLTKEKLLHIARCDEVTAILYRGDAPGFERHIEPDPVPLTPEEKLSDSLKGRLSWLDDGERITVIPQIPQPAYEVICAAVAAKYGDNVARNPYSDVHKAAVKEFCEGYYAQAYVQLREELGYSTDEVTVLDETKRFSVPADRSEIMRIAACDHVEQIEMVLSGFYLLSGDDGRVDTHSALFRRFMAWGDENGHDDGFLDGVSCFKQLYTKLKDDETIQWAILAAEVGFPPPWEVKCGGIVADRFVYSIGGYDLFLSGYALYDAEKDDFVELGTVDAADYPGLYEAIWELGLGNPIGDADFDGAVTILDATHIQRALVELDYLEGCTVLDEGMAKMRCPVADADRSGDVTILDATAIQRVLAGLD